MGKKGCVMDLAKELGAEETFSTQRLCLYIPDQDKNGTGVSDYENWVIKTYDEPTG